MLVVKLKVLDINIQVVPEDIKLFSTQDCLEL